MPYKESETEKVYWSIGETSEMLKLNQSTLRFWEEEFDTIHPKKNKKGDRFYTKKEIEQLKLILYLTREKGYTLKGAKERMKQKKDESEVQFQTVETLKKIKEFLLQIKEQL